MGSIPSDAPFLKHLPLSYFSHCGDVFDRGEWKGPMVVESNRCNWTRLTEVVVDFRFHRVSISLPDPTSYRLSTQEYKNSSRAEINANEDQMNINDLVSPF